MSERHRRLYFLVMFALVFYLVGASFVESFVTYPTWRFVGRNEFPAYYAELASRIIGTDGNSPETVQRLVRIDYLTQAASMARAALYLWMMAGVVGEPARKENAQ